MRVVVIAGGVASALAVALLACNAVLGIDQANHTTIKDAGNPGTHMDGAGNGTDAGIGTDAADAGNGMDAGDAGDVEAGPQNNPALTCANYCKLVGEECTGVTAEYIPDHPEICASICAQFPVSNYGKIDDTNTIGLGQDVDPAAVPDAAESLNCRVWHANFAITSGDPTTHCPHAGPLGGKTCGADPCPIFCALQHVACSALDAGRGFDTVAACMGACEPDGGYPGFLYTVGTPAFEGGVASALSGNTIDCRMYHVEAALKNDPAEGPAFHCPHTGNPSLNSDGTPGGPCN
jgi:hypothetical protein